MFMVLYTVYFIAYYKYDRLILLSMTQANSSKNMAIDEFKFKATISKMGNKRQIIIPTALHEILKEGFEDVTVMITVSKKLD